MQSRLTKVAQEVCEKRYFQKDKDGNFTEDWEGLATRVVNHVCKNEDEDFKAKIYDLIVNTKFIPNSPCLVNSGNEVSGLLACHVSPDVQDSWEGMANNIKLFGDVARRGGGNGVCLSKIRPINDPVFGSTHAKACGPVAHMTVISEAMHSITQSGFRSMANMATMHVSHPDIINFIKCKQKDKALKHMLREDIFNNYDQVSGNIDHQISLLLDKHISNFNISVVVSDEFMKAVENDGDFDLKFGGKIYQTIKARDLFNLIAENAWKNGDPGLLFDDAVNDGPYKYSGQKITATNPCFHGDSLVAVADGRGFVSIKQLAEEEKDVPVYCCDPQSGATYIKWGRNPRKTRSDAPLCKVTFDDGGEITTTPDHKVLLRNGEYVEVQNLNQGSSVMSMTKFEYLSHRSRYYGIVRGDNQSTKTEHKMINEFHEGLMPEGSLVHHKDFDGLNNDKNNLQRMSVSDHSAYHRKFNNPMTHWYPNATPEERQKYHDNMSAATTGESNGMYGKKHSNASKQHIGAKTSERCKDEKYKQRLVESIKNSWTDDRKKECSNKKKTHWREGKYDSLKSDIVTKNCEWCGKEFSKKSFLAEQLRFCSVECGNQIDVSDSKIIDNAICFVEKHGVYPSVSTWETFDDAVCTRELIRTRFGNFQKLAEKLIDLGQFASLSKNTKMTPKLISAAIVRWTIDHGIEPTKKEIIQQICSTQSLNRNGGFKVLIQMANNICLEHAVNHKVSAVEMLDETDDVYNITVDKFHNLCIFSNQVVKPGHATKYSKRRRNVSRYVSIVYRNCGEQPLPAQGSCNLGSIDISKYYDPQNRDIDWSSLRKSIHIAVQFLDNVIDVNKFPTKEFEKWAKENRPVGLGIMGWADLLLKLRIAYGSSTSIDLAHKLASFLEKEAHKQSVKLAKERGTPKACKYSELSERRNVTLTSIAPTGSISLLAGCSSSIEPVFSPVTYRYDNTGQYEMPHDDAPKQHFRSAINPDSSKEVKWRQHVDMQAAFQKFGSSGISKTINMSNCTIVQEVKDAYMRAWHKKCKGITVYRDGCKTTQVLNTSKAVVGSNNAKQRPKEVEVDIYKTRADGFEWHVIVGKVDDVPYEVFAVNGRQELPSAGTVIKKKRRHYSLLDENREVLIDNIGIEEDEINPKIGLETRRFSLELRHNIHPKYIVEQIDKSDDVITSFSKAVGRIMKTKYISADDMVTIIDLPCEDCARKGKVVQMISEAGCSRCPICHNSRCG